MIHVPQEPRDCAIAAVAMITGVDYQELRNTEAGIRWRSVLAEQEAGTVMGWQLPLMAVAKAAGWSKMRFLKRGYTYDSWIDARRLRGRGLLHYEHGEKGSHLVAFEDYVIYDSNADGPEYYEDWKLNRGDKAIKRYQIVRMG
jgi:hypothetical protein